MSPHAKLRDAHRKIREAWRLQGKHSGVVHSELSVILVAVERLCEVVEGLVGPAPPPIALGAEDAADEEESE